MSNGFHPDALSVHYLAAELARRLRGRSCALAPVLGPATVALPLDRGEELRLGIGPGDVDVALVATRTAPGDGRITGVEAPLDDRCLLIHLAGGSRFRPVQRTLRVEWFGARRNAILLDPDTGRVLAAAHERPSGPRPVRIGEPLADRPAAPRLGAEGAEPEALRTRWRESVGRADADDRQGVLLRTFAWTGPLSAPFILGEGGDADAAFQRWQRMAERPPAEPVVMEAPRGPRAYPLPLPGAATRPAPSLIEAVAEAGGEGERGERADRVARAREQILRLLQRAEARRERLTGQLEETGRSESWRTRGDLLLASLRQVPEGAERVTLPDFEGGEVTLELDPSLSPAANADRFYREAGRLDRARERLPRLIVEAEAEAERLRERLARLDRGELPPPAPAQGGDGGDGGGGEDGGRAAYRRYRTSGGLEVRVGRGRKENDRLTFGHSSPDDLWLHARSVPGSHVILRWSGKDDPPRRDLVEAATLAAWYSKARSSGTVPVDWTRRKHVRKPRGAPPGAVTPGQVRTVFVEPDGSVERRLRSGPGK